MSGSVTRRGRSQRDAARGAQYSCRCSRTRSLSSVNACPRNLCFFHIVKHGELRLPRCKSAILVQGELQMCNVQSIFEHWILKNEAEGLKTFLATNKLATLSPLTNNKHRLKSLEMCNPHVHDRSIVIYLQSKIELRSELRARGRSRTF